MNYKGTIIEESLEDKSVLKMLKVLKTNVEPVTEDHKTPWVKQWTLHEVEIPESEAEDMAGRISRALVKDHAWYADFKNKNRAYIIFRRKIFVVDNNDPAILSKAREYGISLGIPEYQVDFK